MRSVVATSILLLVAACGDAPIGSYPDPSEAPLPDRAPGAPDGGASSGNPPTAPVAPQDFTLTVTLTGGGTATITSAPTGVTCAGTTCTGKFPSGTTVTLTTALTAGTIFGGWTGGCTGAGACAPVMNADVAVTAELDTLDGAWSGSYTNLRPANGCNFTNAGTLNASLTTAAGGTTTTANVTGLELRQSGSCNLTGMTTGSAPSSNVTVTGTTVTGNWVMNVSGASGTLPFPFTGTLAGKTLKGTWTCTGCTGSFSLTKP